VTYRTEWSEEVVTGLIFKKRRKIGGTIGTGDSLHVVADNAGQAIRIAKFVIASYSQKTSDIKVVDVHKESMRVYV
jgi:hypothetical protein